MLSFRPVCAMMITVGCAHLPLYQWTVHTCRSIVRLQKYCHIHGLQGGAYHAKNHPLLRRFQYLRIQSSHGTALSEKHPLARLHGEASRR